MTSTLALSALLLGGSAPMWAASFVATASGNWNDAPVWGGSQVPGDHDTVTIQDGVTVTVSDARIVGLSGGNGTTAMALGHAGALVVAAGGTLQVRGDIVYSTGDAASHYLTVQAGGIFEWDSSQAASPRATGYNAHPDADSVARGFVAAGTSANHAIVRSNSGGGNGYFGLGGRHVGGSYTAAYTDFLRIGDAAHPAFAKQWSGLGDNLAPWDFTHNTFTFCGLAPASSGNMANADVFRHDFNVHSSSAGDAVLSLPGDPVGTGPICRAAGNPAGCTAPGVRELIGNVFDIVAGSFDARDFTIHSNYFGDRIVMLNTAQHTWLYFQNNFYRDRQPAAGSALTASGDVRDCLFFLDDPNTDRPQIISLGAAGPEMIFGNILDHSGDVAGDAGRSPGEFVLMNVPLAQGTPYAVKNNILLPDAAGRAGTEIASLAQCCNNAGNTFYIDHNTYFGQRSPGLNSRPGLNQDHPLEGGPNLVEQLASFRSNIAWSDSATTAGSFLAAATDVCQPANCDYNDGWNTRTATYSNRGTGMHDRSVNPRFVDASRNTATFDSAYLGNTPDPWSSGAAYKAGAMVSSADPTVYGGAAINYRYINAAGCSNANPQPGLYTAAARACWEWATLYRLRQAVAAQTLYDDQSIGAHGVDLITVLIQWIRAGFSPSNPALCLSGHDGQDVGAVAVTFAPAATQASSSER